MLPLYNAPAPQLSQWMSRPPAQVISQPVSTSSQLDIDPNYSPAVTKRYVYRQWGPMMQSNDLMGPMQRIIQPTRLPGLLPAQKLQRTNSPLQTQDGNIMHMQDTTVPRPHVREPKRQLTLEDILSFFI